MGNTRGISRDMEDRFRISKSNLKLFKDKRTNTMESEETNRRGLISNF